MGQNISSEGSEGRSPTSNETPQQGNTKRRINHEFFLSNGDLETVGDLDSILQAISIKPISPEEEGGWWVGLTRIEDQLNQKEVIEVGKIQEQQQAIRRVMEARSKKFILRLSAQYPEEDGNLFSRLRVSTMISVASYCDVTTQTLLAKVNHYFNSLIRTSRTSADIQCQTGWVDAINRSPFLKTITLHGECTPEDTKRFCHIIKNDGFPELSDVKFVYVDDDSIKSILSALNTRLQRALRLNLLSASYTAGVTLAVYDLSPRLCLAFAEASTSLRRVLGRLHLLTDDPEGLEAFFKAVDFSAFSALAEIDLSSCPLQRKGAEIFFRSLWPEGVSPADLPPVKKLLLRDTQLGNAAAVSLRQVMRRGLCGNLADLELASNKLSHGGMRALADALGGFAAPNLRRLELSDNFVGSCGLVEVFAALAQGAAPLLEELELAHTGVGTSDMAQLKEFVGSPFAENLRRLNVSNNPQITESISGLFSALQRGPSHLQALLLEGVSLAMEETKSLVGWLVTQSASSLRGIVLRSNLLDGACFRLFLATLVDPRAPRLQAVDFSSNLIGRFDEKEWLALLASDGNRVDFEQLDFSFNPLSDEDVRLFVMFLSRFSSMERVTRIAFASNGVSASAMDYLLRALPEGATALNYLAVDSCSLPGAGPALEGFLAGEACCNLATLALRDCGLTAEDLQALLRGLAAGVCNKLVTLRLDGNGEVDDEFVERFLEVYGRPNTLTNLSRLDLAYTQIGVEGVMMFVQFFRENPNTKLYALDLSSIGLHSEQRNELKQLMKDVWVGHCSL